MAVVVTGAAGFVGDAVVTQLLRAGERVVGVDRLPVARRPWVRSIQADLNDRDPEVVAALRRADAVIHLAGCPGVRDRRPDIAHRRRRDKDNVDATRAVLASTPAVVPLVVVSSSSVYGGARFGRASREDDPLQPMGGYAESKVSAERVCKTRLDTGGPTVVARPFTAVGEGQRPDMALSRWVEAARAGRPLRVLGGVHRTRDFTDVRDVARAITALLGSAGIVNVGTGRPRALAQAIEAVAAAVGVDPVVDVVPAATDEVSDTWADPSRLRELTGLQPCTDLRDVAARIVGARRSEYVA
jgi:nucleoside-diphosphate-sugar epimerase